MPVESMDLETCAREPIHVPGSIQPCGLLLVVDPRTDRVVQAAGHAGLLGIDGRLAGKTAYEFLGVSLDTLMRRSGARLRLEPTYGSAGRSSPCC